MQEAAVELILKEEWMGSESRAASMGRPECVSFEVVSAASSVATAHALEELEAEENDMLK